MANLYTPETRFTGIFLVPTPGAGVVDVGGLAILGARIDFDGIAASAEREPGYRQAAALLLLGLQPGKIASLTEQSPYFVSSTREILEEDFHDPAHPTLLGGGHSLGLLKVGPIPPNLLVSKDRYGAEIVPDNSEERLLEMRARGGTVTGIARQLGRANTQMVNKAFAAIEARFGVPNVVELCAAALELRRMNEVRAYMGDDTSMSDEALASSLSREAEIAIPHVDLVTAPKNRTLRGLAETKRSRSGK